MVVWGPGEGGPIEERMQGVCTGVVVSEKLGRRFFVRLVRHLGCCGTCTWK